MSFENFEANINIEAIHYLAKPDISDAKMRSIARCLLNGGNFEKYRYRNCWRNRLIGEKKVIPESERFTIQTSTYLDAKSELQSSGLLGPVRILSIDYNLL